MAEDIPPLLAERIFAMFNERFAEWLGERGIVTLALVCVLVLFLIACQKARNRPEFKFIIDLSIDTAVAFVFSQSIHVFTDEIVKHAHESQGFATTNLGEVIIMVMEALHYLPLLVIFAFQALRLWKDIQTRLEGARDQGE